jgi:hypothetical protein
MNIFRIGFIFLLSWIVAGNKTLAQNRNSIWVFGDSSLVDFGNAGSPVTGVSGMDGRGSCVSISDTSGSLLFYAFTRALFPVKSGD